MSVIRSPRQCRAAALPALAIVLVAAACDARGAPAVARAPESAATVIPDGGAAAPDTRLALAEDGLRLVDGRSGATRLLSFGASRAQLLPALRAAYGRPRDGAVNPDCGAGAQESIVWRGGLVTWFQGDRFVGWSVGGARPDADATALDATAADTARRPATMAGVGPGSTRRELETAYATRVAETSLGTEFEAGGLHGVLDADGAAGRIASLWAGTTCILR